MGETDVVRALAPTHRPFSILERIVMGETTGGRWMWRCRWPFSILERIVMGETLARVPRVARD